MNKFKNIKIRNKLIISFVLISLISSLVLYLGNRYALQRITDDALPTIQTINQTTQLISDIQRESMEYFTDDEEPEQLDEHIEALSNSLNALRILSDDEDEVGPFNELADLASENADLSLRLVASHTNTKGNIEALNERIPNNELLFLQISERVDEEVERSVESGELDDLIEDAIPTLNSITQFKDDIHLMELSVQSFLLTGDEEALQTYEAAQKSAQATLTQLEETLEANEANEAELLASLGGMLEETSTLGRNTLDSHLNTLELLEEMEALEVSLTPMKASVAEFAARDVNESLATARTNLLITSVVSLFLALVLALVMSQAIATPIVRLTAVSNQITQGDLTAKADEASKDETGTLAHAFNLMTTQLRSLLENLEERVAARTEDLNLASDIGRQVTQARDVATILNKAATLIKEQFSLYQVQIYLTEANRENLILRASDGFAGSRLLDVGHTLPIDEQSLNGSAAYQKQAVLVANTQESASFRPHPLLPDTRSEMVVPLMIEDEVLGVMDLQSTEANSLTEEILPAFNLLAEQLAIAILNARQNRAIQENQQLMRTIINSSPDWIFVKDHEHRYQVVNQAYANSFHISPEEFIGKNDLDLGFPEEIVKGNPEKGIRGFWADDREIMDSGKVKQIPEEPGEVDGKPVVLQTVKVPLMDAVGNVVGIVGFVHDITNRKQAEETIAQRADELQTVADLSTAVSTIADPQQLLQAVVDLTKQRFDLYHAHIYLVDDSGQNLVLTAGAGEAGKTMVAEGLSIPLNQEQSLVSRAARGKEGVIVNDVMTDTGFLPNPLLPRTRSEMAIPIIIGSDVLGVLDVQADRIGRFSDQDIQIQTTLASQTAVALQNARQYNKLQQSQESIRERETLLRTIIDSTPNWIFVKDSNHRYLMVNQGYADSLNMNPDDFIGKNDLDIGFPEEIVKGNPEKGIRGFWADDREIMERGELVVIDMEPAVIDGEERFLNTIKAPLLDNAGNVVGIVGFVHDITNRILSEELMRERESLLRTIIDTSPDQIIVKSRENRFVLVNQAFANEVGKPVDDIIGKNDIEIGRDEEHVKGNPEKGIIGYWAEDQAVMRAGQPVVIENINEESISNKIIKTPLKDKDGNITGLVVFVQDITAEKRGELEQRKLAQAFEEQLTQVNALQRAMTRENWAKYIDAQQKDETGFSFNGQSVEPFDSNSLKAITGGLPIDLEVLSQMAYDESQTAVILPLQLHNESIGFIGARSANDEPINAEQNALLTTLTAQVAESLDRARLFEETELGRQEIEAQAAELSTVNEISELVSTQLNINDLVNAVGDRLIETFSANSVYIALVDEKTGTIKFPYFTNVIDGPMNIAPRTLDDKGGFTAKIYQTREPVIHNPTDQNIASAAKKMGAAVIDSSHDSNSYIGIPMTVGKNVIGVIGINGQQDRRKYDEEDIPLLTTLASTIAIALQNAQQFENTQRRANREAMVNEISQKIQSAPTIEKAMQTAVAELGKALGIQHAVVELKTNQSKLKNSQQTKRE